MKQIEDQTIQHIEESFPALEKEFSQNFDKHLDQIVDLEKKIPAMLKDKMIESNNEYLKYI